MMALPDCAFCGFLSKLCYHHELADLRQRVAALEAENIELRGPAVPYPGPAIPKLKVRKSIKGTFATSKRGGR